MKRALAILLSLFVMVLSAIPCIDAPGHSLTKTELQTEHSQHPEGQDDCSPFCTCVCCATPVVQATTFIYLNDLQLMQEYSSVHRTDFQSSLYSAIWQPPKCFN
ncbi:MAG: DUF6660 family protein [Bacteroidales bacterium]